MTCLGNLVIERLSHLNLLRDPPVQGYQEVNLPTNVRLVKAMVFPVVMYGCESWAVKKAEH